MLEKINPYSTIGNIVAMHPQTRKVFEKYQIDYCCGGERNIKTAVEEKNISLDEFLSSLEEAINEKDNTKVEEIWTEATLTDLINHIISKHHAFLWEQLPSTGILLDKIVQVHGPRHGDSLIPINKIYKELKGKFEKHLTEEETILFPYVKKLEKSITDEISDTDKVRYIEIIKTLHREHEETGKELTDIRALASDYVLPEDACLSYEALYEKLKAIEDDVHEHVHLENTILFPKIEKLITQHN